MNADLVVLWGRNTIASEPLLWDWVNTNRKERGAKLMVIDPRFSEVAQQADLFLQIRPGTDAALALGWINVIIEEDLYDHEFVDEWCVASISCASAPRKRKWRTSRAK